MMAIIRAGVANKKDIGTYKSSKDNTKVNVDNIKHIHNIFIFLKEHIFLIIYREIINFFTSEVKDDLNNALPLGSKLVNFR